MSRTPRIRFLKLVHGILLACLFLTLATLPLVGNALANDAELSAQLEAMFTDAYPSDEPGGAVCIKRGDEILLRAGYGLAQVELNVPMTPDMIFRIGSITKQFTAVAVLQLAAAGALDLDAPLGTYLPDYPEPGAAITVRQLLNHTGGIPNYTDDMEFMENMCLDMELDDIIATWQDRELDFEPGSDWIYSNSGYVLLGKLIEVASQLEYADYMAERVFEPLGLEHTMYGDPGRIIPNRAAGYDPGADGHRNAVYISMTLPHAAGALLSTVDDMVTWCEAELGGSELLPETWHEELVTRARLNDGRLTGYACGLNILEYNGHEIIGHGGGINGFITHVAHVPDEDLSVVVLSNNLGSDPAPHTLTHRAIALVLGAPLDSRPQEELPVELLADLAGVYRNEADAEERRILRLDEDDQLTSQRTGGSQTPIHFTSHGEFYFDDSLTFGRVEYDNDSVTGLWIRASMGPEERWRKTDEPIPTREPMQLDDLSLLDALVGRYELMPGFEIEVRREGDGLMLQATGQDAAEIFPETESRWYLTVVDAEVEFRGHEDGQADELVLFQGGQEMPATRVE